MFKVSVWNGHKVLYLKHEKTEAKAAKLAKRARELARGKLCGSDVDVFRKALGLKKKKQPTGYVWSASDQKFWVSLKSAGRSLKSGTSRRRDKGSEAWQEGPGACWRQAQRH